VARNVLWVFAENTEGGHVMFRKIPGYRKYWLGVLAVGVLSCQQQQQQQQQQPQQAAGPISFAPGPFDGLEATKFDLLATKCDMTGATVNITVADNEFAYVYLRTDNQVVVNATNTDDAACVFASSKKIHIVSATAVIDKPAHKVLLDFLNGQFAAGGAGTNGIDALGITIDLGTDGGTNQVLFRGTVNPDIFTLGTLSTVSYVSFSTASSSPAAKSYADISLANVTDILISTGAG
jgi:hypothetical protein